MCGRARCSLSREAVLMAAGVSERRWRDQAHYRPSYNCSPGAWIPVMKLGTDGAREVQTMKWGLVPTFARLAPGERPDHFRMFNARCESLAQKPVFNRLLPGKRCVVLLDGFYEWHSQGGGGAASRKQPYYITTATTDEKKQQQQPAMYLAGLFDVYRDPNGGEPLHTFTIITTDSSKPLAWLHDRMPVILATPEEVSAWLGDGKAEVGCFEGAVKVQALAAAALSKEEEDKEKNDCRRCRPTQEQPRSPPPPAKSAAAKPTAEPQSGGGSPVPSTPSSQGAKTSGRRSAAGGGPPDSGPSPNEGGSETKATGSGAADAIEILDDDEEEREDGGRRGEGVGGAAPGDGGGGGGEAADGEMDSGDSEARCSQGKVGGSQAESQGRGGGRGTRRGQGGSGKAAARGDGVLHDTAERQRCEELVEAICRPYGGPLLRWHPVTPEMSKPGYDKPECCKDVRTKKGSIASFFKPAAKAAATGAGAGAGASPAAAVAAKEDLKGPQVIKGEVEEVKVAARLVKAELSAAARNSDECKGASGEEGAALPEAGSKRPAEGEAGGVGAAAPAVKKR